MCGRIVPARGEANTNPQRREKAARAAIKARVKDSAITSRAKALECLH